MSAHLEAQLGALVRRTADGLVAEPASERALIELLHALRDRGARLHRDVRLSRRAFADIGAVAERSMTVDVGAGVALRGLEAHLAARGLSLGPLPAAALALSLADFLEGPWAGLRSIPGGRLEPLCTSLRAVLADGRRLETPRAPRSAAGPELAALLLGAEGRLGLVTAATVRCQPRPEEEARQAWRFATAAALVQALTAALAAGALPWEVAAGGPPGAVLAEVRWAGSAGGVARDRDVLHRASDAAGGAPAAERLAGPLPEGAREATWAAVQAALERGAALTLTRLSLGTAVVAGEVEGVALDGPGAWAPAATRLLGLDALETLGGAP